MPVKTVEQVNQDMRDTNQSMQLLGTNFVDILRWRARHNGEKQAFLFQMDGQDQEVALTYAELDEQAHRIAAILQHNGAQVGERVLLLYQPGLDYVEAVFGCFYAGVIAVPAYPPRLNHNLERIENIIHDADVRLTLTVKSIHSGLQRKFASHPLVQRLQWIVTDEQATSISAEQWQPPLFSSDMLALLQYTSGSTGNPKGVMITHNNLIQNARIIQEGMELNENTKIGSWLPPYHDMGLMGGILEALYVGSSSVLMTPTSFLQQPLRWLRMISHHQVYASSAPNFAFDLCVEKVTPEQLVGLDLHTWEVAATGAEPVRAETIRRFTETFAPYGFREEAFYPCYGMAETTLFISGGTRQKIPYVQNFDVTAIEAGKVEVAQTNDASSFSLVSCGYLRTGQRAVIVNPATQTLCAPDQIGEIWVAAPNVARGYWHQSEATAETFQAFSTGSNDGPFLRTGDLGFFFHDELFITGRLKDMIILHGRNLYPQDIERVVGQSHPALRQNSCAAFAITIDGIEQLVLVQEVRRHYDRWDTKEIVQSIRQAVLSEFDVTVTAVELLRAGTIYKTSSGKIQRNACRQGFLRGELKHVYRWQQGSLKEPQRALFEQAAVPSSRVSQEDQGEQEIVAWLVTHLAEHAQIDPQHIDLQAPFVSYGLNSLQAIGLSGELERWLGRPLAPTLVYEYSSIAALAQYLANGKSPDMETLDRKRNAPAGKQGGIAVVGMACRFPGARTPEEFWEFLCAGGDGITEASPEHWDIASSRERLKENSGEGLFRWGGFLTDIDLFDAGFFRISPQEAEQLDPQQRLLLEVSWEAFERAGMLPTSLAGSQTGVFIGISSSDYYTIHATDPTYHRLYTGTGNAHSIAANRLSYFFDFHGPSMAIDTACSSSLVAIHQACQSLRHGECTVALAGGVNVILSPALTSTFTQANMMAADGHCKTFDAAADGYVRGEGCGVVILKPLEDAQRDGDQILAVIRGSAVNQDGASNGLTAPNGLAQEMVIRQALDMANVQPEQIGYVETHGTGTALGDPIEVKALTAVLMPERTAEQTCVLGAVKTNIGHLESAAGIASLIKVVLSLHHGIIPPNLHFSTVNPHIALDESTFVIPTEAQRWSNAYERRIAGVSAFGFGGTNAHAIVEAATPAVQSIFEHETERERPIHLLTLSAHSANALQRVVNRYQQYLTNHPTTPISDVCFSANTGRVHFPYRYAIMAETSPQLQERLASLSTTTHPSMRSRKTQRPKIAFLFTGQGSHYHGMARQLYETQPTFRYELEHCDQILREHLDHSLLSVLYVPEHAALLEETAYTQPALFAIEYALTMLWRSWGIEPDMVMGHSVGEYVAACVAGMISLEDSLRLIVRRGQLMQTLPQRGAMLAVRSDAVRLATMLEPVQDKVSLAAINGPDQVVLAGDEEILHTLAHRLEAEHIVVRPLSVSHAFHSPLMEPLLDRFEQRVREIALQPLRIPLVTNLTGKLVPTGEVLTADYWRQQTRSTVQFARGLQTLEEQGCTIFVEIGPHTTLTQMGRHCLQGEQISLLPSLHKQQENWHTLLTGVIELYTRGVEVQWSGFDRDYHRQRVEDIPTYPFEQQRYWFDNTEIHHPVDEEMLHRTRVSTRDMLQQRHPLLQTYLAQIPSANIHVWESDLDAQHLPQLREHRIQGMMALPIFVYVEMVLAAATEAYGPGNYRLSEISMKQLLFIPEQETQKIQLVLTIDADQHIVFSVYSQDRVPGNQTQLSWTLHATGKFQNAHE